MNASQQDELQISAVDQLLFSVVEGVLSSADRKSDLTSVSIHHHFLGDCEDHASGLGTGIVWNVAVYRVECLTSLCHSARGGDFFLQQATTRAEDTDRPPFKVSSSANQKPEHKVL